MEGKRRNDAQDQGKQNKWKDNIGRERGLDKKEKKKETKMLVPLLEWRATQRTSFIHPIENRAEVSKQS